MAAACRCTADWRRSNTMANLVCRVRKKTAAVAVVAVAVAVVECRNRKVGKELVQPAHKAGRLACWRYRMVRTGAGRKFAAGLLLLVL